MLKSSNGMDVVYNRWESVISLLRDYIPIGSRDFKFKNFETRLLATYNNEPIVKY